MRRDTSLGHDAESRTQAQGRQVGCWLQHLCPAWNRELRLERGGPGCHQPASTSHVMCFISWGVERAAPHAASAPVPLLTAWPALLGLPSRASCQCQCRAPFPSLSRPPSRTQEQRSWGRGACAQELLTPCVHREPCFVLFPSLRLLWWTRQDRQEESVLNVGTAESNF